MKLNTKFMIKYKQKALIPGFNVEKETKDQIMKVCNEREMYLTDFLQRAITAYLNTLNRNK